MPQGIQLTSSALDYNPAMSNNPMEDYYRRQLQKHQEMVLRYQEKERLRLEKEQEEFEKRKQDFELQFAREREMLNYEKKTCISPNQLDIPNIIHLQVLLMRKIKNRKWKLQKGTIRFPISISLEKM